MLRENIIDCIGETPMVRLDKIRVEEGISANLYAKLELFNAGGSVKDRIAKRMVEEAEKDGRLKPGSVVIEPSSGNTGIGLALVCAAKGYRCIITMPEKMSLEKENVMKALGAEVVRTPTEAAHDSPFSNLGKAKSLLTEISGSVMLDQYGNDDNPNAHYYGTGSEIVTDLSNSSTPIRKSSNMCDLFVGGVGTGGTITGISRRLKESNKNVLILGVDPRGSLLARPESLNGLKQGQNDQYKVEGIGYDFIPDVLKHQAIDSWVKIDDDEAFSCARRIIRTEAILCGGSCGSALAGCLRFLKTEEGKRIAQDPEANIVVLMPDSIRNYVTSQWLLAPDISGKSNGHENGHHLQHK